MSAISVANVPVDLPAPELSDEPLYEIIDGVKVELPPMSAYACVIASKLLGELVIYAKPRDVGYVVMETLFNMQQTAGRNRRPDVAFVSFERWPKEKPMLLRQNAWEVTPDLAVEIISPSDPAEDLSEKIIEYFQARVRQVWVIYPRTGLLYLYRSLREIQVFDRQGVLEAEDLLPDFRLPLAELFPPSEDPTEDQTDEDA